MQLDIKTVVKKIAFDILILQKERVSVKLKLEKIKNGDDEIVIRYKKMNPTIEEIVNLTSRQKEKLLAKGEKGNTFLWLDDILYCERVDGIVFAYTKNKVYQIFHSLRDLEASYYRLGYVRCSKSMIVNIYKIHYFNSEPYGRIRATMENDEEIMISRKYANRIRTILQEGGQDEE
ncbi:LytTR family DNA-binding domain-containing protein [Streptococcus mutans]|uniref:LytTR family DNA-binding domain-containing protein n=1 Tax=Streptococcus mutans TaxID=1309 RepID=UPI00037B3D8D|nr:LytTR family DNA-binding domain-containing protein [Streptococcus mutans]MCY7129400.1 LytTR family transcriptional regulator DNA-binding domain-containing protein [Streptococcus mutans]OVF00386.1 LytTR family transcriptional regulator [Streptococcus mutans]